MLSLHRISRVQEALATQTSSPTEALPPTDASPLMEALEMTSRICIGLRLEIRGRKGYALIKLKCRKCVLVHSHRKYVIVRSTYVLFGVAWFRARHGYCMTGRRCTIPCNNRGATVAKEPTWCFRRPITITSPTPIIRQSCLSWYAACLFLSLILIRAHVEDRAKNCELFQK